MMAGDNIILQGRAYDPGGEPVLGWYWTLDAPGGGLPPSIAGASSPGPTFTAESPGMYVLSLVVDNGVESSEPDFTIITVGTNQQPVAVAAADRTFGPAPLTVNFNGFESTEPDFQPLTYAWYFSEGSTAEGPGVTHQYSVPGTYLATLTVTDDHGAVDLATLEISVTQDVGAPAADAAPGPGVLTDDGIASGYSSAGGLRLPGSDAHRATDAAAVADDPVNEVTLSDPVTTTGRIKHDLLRLADPMTDPVPVIDPVSAASSVQFGAAGYPVAEDAETALVWVTRTGSTVSAISVDYAMDEFTATAGSDYTVVSGTLSFARGEIMQAVRVPVLDDNVHEGSESFVLFLYNVSDGVSLEAQRVTFVTIIDNDTVVTEPVPLATPALSHDPVPVPAMVTNTQCTATPGSTFAQRERCSKGNDSWTINLLSSTDRADVEAIRARAERLNIPAEIKDARIDGTRYWRLQVNGFNSRSDADKGSANIKEQLGIDNVWIFRQRRSDNIAISGCGMTNCPELAGENL